jgi:two-component system CheB/CheR fusion protein
MSVRSEDSPQSPARCWYILIVEDHADTARVLSRLLISAGFRTFVAITIADARRLCSAFTFDAILCDIGLPDGSGLELPSLVRPLCPHTKLIALSGYAMEEDRRAGYAAGFDLYLGKPVILQELLPHLR